MNALRLTVLSTLCALAMTILAAPAMADSAKFYWAGRGTCESRLAVNEANDGVAYGGDVKNAIDTKPVGQLTGAILTASLLFAAETLHNGGDYAECRASDDSA